MTERRGRYVDGGYEYPRGDWMRPVGQRRRLGEPGYFRPRSCPTCGTTFSPNSPRQIYCRNCGRPGKRRAHWRRSVCACPPCHNLLKGGWSGREGKRHGWLYCSDECAAWTPPELPLAAGHPTRIVVDFLVAGRSISEIAGNSGLSVGHVVETLRDAGVRDPYAERSTAIPDRLWRDLRKVRTCPN